MAYASRSGRATTSATNPRAFAVCSRCSRWFNHDRLRFQHDWRGAALLNTYQLVCNSCYDTPQEQLRAIVVPADPTPIVWALTEPFEQDETDYQTISAPTVYDPITGIPIPSTTTLLTQDGQNLTTQPVGAPLGLEPGAIMPLNNDTGQPLPYAVELPILSVIANGTDVIAVTCYEPHGLSTNAQISIEGLNVKEANGFYSITVISATAFSYQTNKPITAGSLLESVTIING